jgi:hypothetical protein
MMGFARGSTHPTGCASGLKYPLPPVHRTLDLAKEIDYAKL